MGPIARGVLIGLAVRQACEQLDDLGGRRVRIPPAVQATAAGSYQTDAPDRLAALLAHIARMRAAPDG